MDQQQEQEAAIAQPKPTAMVTGASSGIGEAFARLLAEKGYDLVLCARRADKLEALAEDLSWQSNVTCIPLDLSKTKSPKKLYSEIKAQGIEVDVLVNNAGTAFQGRFADMPANAVCDMVNLNIRSVSELTHLFLPDMISRGSGKILNVASVVSFQAIPGMALYSATKSFVLSFSESLAEEVRDSGVTVCALCPGLTKTELADDLGVQEIPGAPLFMDDPMRVAKAGLDALDCKNVVSVPGLINQAVVSWAEYQPRWFKRTLAGIAGRAVFNNLG